jgi:hypothetical protein
MMNLGTPQKPLCQLLGMGTALPGLHERRRRVTEALSHHAVAVVEQAIEDRRGKDSSPSVGGTRAKTKMCSRTSGSNEATLATS